MQKKQPRSNIEFIPVFKASFFYPKYWGVWLGVGAMLLLAYVPAKIRNPFLGLLGKWVGKYAGDARRRARINLYYCFPEMEEREREELIDEMFATASQSMMLMVEQAVRSPEFLLKRTRWHGEEIIEAMRAEGRNVIFMVPHGWSVDVPAMLLAAKGQKMAAMFHNQKNELVDWMWNAARRRFGGRMHARDDGIKPFISSVRQGYWGYYLPDQDHGAEHSEFVDFFGTYKATMPAVGRLMKVCHAAIVPLFPVYRAKEGILDVYIHPPMDDIAEADNETIARRMNEELEKLVMPNREQYVWILKFIKTRRNGEIQPYKRKDLWPRKKK
ncbi:Lipid A biosynthesis (KDO)2-(lauroyl)-lipid IVA acyltransferase [Leminorella richardii]|uniref:Lipid A biosynthesis acyltransferase n=1 Tax=Leminorella richardii TaxID=158841 RepID=A0A2X4V7J3_9GAMM|nr:lauroyl-Kdo(2)-lipid IV(A) myristoyltransferase [Leminorella richardii]SQI41240.1 Lipid A biosynthesis (KDO)2-(lauroyl)-lipid IVA acyltransferase [Leminorella richardii]